jgi:Icc-related predicted phosphoesterase
VSFLSNLKERLNQESTNGENGGMDKEAGVTRLFFATDVHGSTVCWRKFLNSAEFYDADVLILGGDTTGKAIFPIIDEGDRYTYVRSGDEKSVQGDGELTDLLDSLENAGYYPYVLDGDEYDDLQNADTDDLQNEIFESEMKARIREWTALAEERLDGEIPVYVCPGNDDPFDIDDVWRESDVIELVEGEVIDIDDDYQMVSSGWTHPSPWDTDREEAEEELEDRLADIIAKADAGKRTIFNFHDPPYDSQLDEAPELDEELRPKFGARSTEPVGSTAVRDLIEEHQPPLSLHGHIHESRAQTTIGETTAVNPGSVYSEGSLQGAVVDLKPAVDVVGLVRG